jgi:outer membrane protein assembly factor BamD
MKSKTFTPRVARLLLPLVLLSFAFGCSTVKGWFSSKKPEGSPDVMASQGIQDLQKKKYEDAIETFEKVRDRYPYSDQAMLAQIKLADAYFYKKKYDEALQAYKEFEKLHPTNKAVPYCIYREGLCFYRQRSTIDRDQTFTTKAMDEFSRLKKKYPESEFVSKADGFTAQCRRDLAEHEYYVAQFYFKTERYQAALQRYQTLADEYPDFPKKIEVQKRIAECQKILASPEKEPEGGFFSPVAKLFDAKW